ncbi:MAG: cytochrome c oxidase subunit 3 [Planctomycetes bacterium]|nr:cytochrome c oxidase subunit 3 [Planctomycetota bacterium]
MAMGVWCAQTSRRKGLLVCLILTWIGAAGFMGVKFVEYSHKFHDQIIWGKDFNPTRHVEHEGGAESAHVENAAAPAAASATPAPAAAGVSTVEHSTVPSAAAGPQGLGRTQEEYSVEKAEHHALDAYALASQMRDLHIFMGIYFCLTGLHGFHVLAGMIVIAWLIYGAFKGRYDGKYYTPVDLVGLYWHVVDLVWIFLFPLLYLIH